MSIEVVVVIVSGIFGLVVTIPLWIECAVSLRLARQLEGPDAPGIVAVATEDLVNESVRLGILLIFIGAGALTVIESESVGRIRVWMLAGIPAPRPTRSTLAPPRPSASGP